MASVAPPLLDSQTYYSRIGRGRWRGAFAFRITDRDAFRATPLTLKERLLARARPTPALDARLRGADGAGAEAELAIGRTRLCGRQLDARRGGDGERARDVRPVRAAADLAAHEGGLGGEESERRQARSAVRRLFRKRSCGVFTDSGLGGSR
jgi:hypothetical protein